MISLRIFAHSFFVLALLYGRGVHSSDHHYTPDNKVDSVRISFNFTSLFQKFTRLAYFKVLWLCQQWLQRSICKLLHMPNRSCKLFYRRKYWKLCFYSATHKGHPCVSPYDIYWHSIRCPNVHRFENTMRGNAQYSRLLCWSELYVWYRLG